MRGRSPTQDTPGATKFMTSPRYYEEDEPHWKTVAAPHMTQLYDHSCRQVTQTGGATPIPALNATAGPQVHAKV